MAQHAYIQEVIDETRINSSSGTECSLFITENPLTTKPSRPLYIKDYNDVVFEVAGSGAQGSQGTQGSQGFQGSIGTGSQGAQGFQGSSGGAQGAQGSQGSQGNAGTGGNAIIPFSFGVGTITPLVPLYMGFGVSNILESLVNFVMPRSGTINNLTITVPLNLFTTITEFTIRRSVTVGPVVGAFFDTTQTLTVGPAMTGVFTSVGAPVVVNQGDRISLEMTSGTGGTIGVIFVASGGIQIL